MSSIDTDNTSFDEYLFDLDSEAVDALDGRILSPGQKVIRSPYNHVLVVADTPDHRRQFIELGFVWDEPTRYNRVKDEVDKLSKRVSYGTIRSIDVALNLNMSVTIIEEIFEDLIQTGDYKWGDDDKNSQGVVYKVIVKR